MNISKVLYFMVKFVWAKFKKKEGTHDVPSKFINKQKTDNLVDVSIETSLI